jgi:hypothetical protein
MPVVPKDTVSPLLRRIGARVKRLREERGWSQVRLAIHSGVNRDQLSVASWSFAFGNSAKTDEPNLGSSN